MQSIDDAFCRGVKLKLDVPGHGINHFLEQTIGYPNQIE